MEERQLGPISALILQGAVKLIELYYYALIARILLSWLPQLQGNRFAEFLFRITEPYLSIFRRFIPPLGMIDISPIVAFIAYRFLSGFLLDGLVQVFRFINV
ncbi:hypothetical protein BEP19_06030 [Ammoniphilus oxalaticus]|uniref:Cell division protein n=1 Tax=Ammoniphilus oxalaticus TaxID=66863 RepID=A0A419SJ08_9BACL|nr:YggT family protein [Ammoniphilus oxalaticus]RKD23975.1 hypothetical protein BEP19_06030 [Ammoniphilus oxalaticus]